jgi:hypothetical protein
MRLIDQFIITRPDGDAVAQELIEVGEWSWLYEKIGISLDKMIDFRYVFIIRSKKKYSKKWEVVDIDFYKTQGWAQNRFDRNKGHILKYVGGK